MNVLGVTMLDFYLLMSFVICKKNSNIKCSHYKKNISKKKQRNCGLLPSICDVHTVE